MSNCSNSDPADQLAIRSTLNAYARACDQRDWDAFDNIFTDEVSVDYGGVFRLQGRQAVVDMIRSMLGGCGPTQHLLGNYDIEVHGDAACSACYVRAIHAGTGAQSDTLYEVWAEYRDALARIGDGWRIVERSMIVHKETGDRGILQPAPEG